MATMLFIEFWDNEGDRIGLGLVLGDSTHPEFPAIEIQGKFCYPNGESDFGSIQAYRGPSEVYYADDGERLVCIAGRPVRYGRPLALEDASNCNTFVIRRCLDCGLAVFTNEEDGSDPAYRFRDVKLKCSLFCINDSPYFLDAERHSKIHHDLTMEDNKRWGLGLWQLAKEPQYRFEDGDWIAFNRIWRDRNWVESSGAFTYSQNGNSQIVISSNVSLTTGLRFGIQVGDSRVVEVASLA